MKSNNVYNVEPHWRPQFFVCPMCAFNYTVYGKVEDLYEDMAYILIKANRTDLADARVTLNHLQSKKEVFWAGIDMESQAELHRLYDMDFIAGGYT